MNDAAWLAVIVALLAGNLAVNAGVFFRLGSMAGRVRSLCNRVKLLEGRI